jgi:hypothetical protein
VDAVSGSNAARISKRRERNTAHRSAVRSIAISGGWGRNTRRRRRTSEWRRWWWRRRRRKCKW